MFEVILNFISVHTFLSVIWLMSFFLMVFFIFKDFFCNVQFITIMELISLINQEKLILVVDTRTKKRFSEGHIINSIHIPFENIKLSHNIEKLNKYIDVPIILIFEHNGEIDKNYINHLRLINCKKFYVLKDGMHSWLSNNYPIILSK